MSFELACRFLRETERERAELERTRQELAAVRELMNVYNLGGGTDTVAPMKRALAAEAELERTRLAYEKAHDRANLAEDELERTRAALRELLHDLGARQMQVSSPILRAYHFCGDTLRDGRPIPPDGEWLVHDGPVTICETGLHASKHPYDALQYAPGATLCLVECEDVIAEQDDKFVCRRRRIVARFDSTELLRSFARHCALSVMHLWDAPPVVRQYLETGDESLRAAAWAAAWGAARAAAWEMPWAAARAAAREAARAAVGAAVGDAYKAEFQRLVDAKFTEMGEL